MTESRKLEIKICGVRSTEAIEALVPLSPDYLGFIFIPESPRYVAENLNREVIKALPASIHAVGVFRNHAIDFVLECVESFHLRIVQLHGAESPEYVRQLKQAGPKVKIWKAIGISSSEDVARLNCDSGGVDRFLLDNGSGGTGQRFDWSLLLNYRAPVPFILAGGIDLTSIRAAVEVSQRVSALAAIDLNSGVESAPGVKDPAKIRDIMFFCNHSPRS